MPMKKKQQKVQAFLAALKVILDVLHQRIVGHCGGGHFYFL